MATILALCLTADPSDLARPIDPYELTADKAGHCTGGASKSSLRWAARWTWATGSRSPVP